MKVHHLALVASIYIAATLASTNINTYGAGNLDRIQELGHHANHADNRARASKSLQDHHAFSGARDRNAAAGSQYKGAASSYGNNAAKSAANGNAAQQNFAKQDAKYDEIARQIAQATKLRGYHSGSEGRYDKLDAKKAKGFNAAGAKKSAYNKGKVFNDNIQYGFNKDFSENLHEKGGYEEGQEHNKHKLDELRDRQKGHKLVRGEHSAVNARDDSQRAIKENKYSQNAAQKNAANGKFGNSEKKLDKAGATQDAQSVLYDRKDSKSIAEDKGHQLASKNANQFANKDNKFGRQAAASHGGAQGHADKEYSGGHGSKGGPGGPGGPGGYDDGLPHPVGVGGHSAGSGGLAKHKYGDHARQTDQGKEHLSQNAGATDQALKQYDQTKKKQDFDQLKSLRDQRKGKFAQGVHSAEKNGFQAKDSNAAKSASGGNRNYADAAAHSNAKAAKHDLDEELFDKENYKKRLHNNNEKFRKIKKFYHDKKAGGKNVERLTYTRKRVENEFGSAQQAQQEKQNQYDNAHKNAKHNSASRKDDFVDTKKASKAFGHHDASKSTRGDANSKSNAFNKASHFDNGNKKQVAESDHSSNKDSLHKKQNELQHVESKAASIKGNGFKNVNGHERDSKGGPSGTVGLNRFGAAQRGDSYGVHDNVAPVHDVHVPHDIHQGGNTGYNNGRPKPHFGSIGGSNFGKFGNPHRQRSLGGGRSGSGSDNIHKFGGNLFGRSGGSYNSHSGSSGSNFGGKQNFGLFGNFNKFGRGSTGAGSNFGSRSGTHSSVHSGGLFNSPFGKSFGKPGLFSNNFRFGKGFKGGLF